MRSLLAAFVLLACAAAQAAPDYAREKRWADEVVPGIVVGDAVFLELGNGHKFLALLTEPGEPRAALIVVHGLGHRGRATLLVHPAGVRITRVGEPVVWIPAEQLRAVRIEWGRGGSRPRPDLVKAPGRQTPDAFREGYVRVGDGLAYAALAHETSRCGL